MMPLILIALLLVSGALAFAPMTERRLRDFGVASMAVISVLAGYIAWPGLAPTIQAAIANLPGEMDGALPTTSLIFGPGSVWYLDGLAAMMMILIALISLSSAVIAHRYLGREHKEGIVSLTDLKHYYAMVPLFIASMYAATLSNNVGLLWISIEATTLSTTLLVAFYRKRSAIEAAWKYVVLCSLGISLGLVGVLLTTYAADQDGVNSSLLLSSFRQAAEGGLVNTALIRWAFVFLFIGIGTKVGFVPMHAWLPDAHSKTPSPVSALLSGILLNVAFVSLLRFRQVTDAALADGGAWTGMFFLVFGCLSIVVPALIMLVQKNYKRLLASSSIEHMGLMAFAVGLGPAGIIPAVLHMPGHAILKSAMFFGAGEIFITYKTTDSAAIKNVWLRLPKTAMLFLLAMLLLLAVPPSAMFASEIIMIGFGLREWLWPTLLVLLALTVAFVAMTRHIYGLLFGAVRPVEKPETPEPWNIVHIVLGVHIALAVALGIFFLTPNGLEFMVSIARSLNATL